MDISTLSHPCLSPVNGKPILLGFDGADMSSDAGLTLLREIERKAGLAQRLASCMADPRDPAKVQHSLADIIRLPVMMIAASYEDGNDADSFGMIPASRSRWSVLPKPVRPCVRSPRSRVWKICLMHVR